MGSWGQYLNCVLCCGCGLIRVIVRHGDNVEESEEDTTCPQVHSTIPDRIINPIRHVEGLLTQLFSMAFAAPLSSSRCSHQRSRRTLWSFQKSHTHRNIMHFHGKLNIHQGPSPNHSLCKDSQGYSGILILKEGHLHTRRADTLILEFAVNGCISDVERYYQLPGRMFGYDSDSRHESQKDFSKCQDFTAKCGAYRDAPLLLAKVTGIGRSSEIRLRA